MLGWAPWNLFTWQAAEELPSKDIHTSWFWRLPFGSPQPLAAARLRLQLVGSGQPAFGCIRLAPFDSRTLSHILGSDLAPLLEERQQIGVDYVLLSQTHAVRETGIDLECGSFNDFGREQRRGSNRNDLIVVTVKNERGDVEFLEIFGEVGLGECLNALVGSRISGEHFPKPERIPDAL
jgi:hypothetical protein